MKIISILKSYQYFTLRPKSMCFSSSTDRVTNFEKYLTPENLEKCVQKFSHAKIPITERKFERNASVLIPLCYVNNEPSLLFILRAADMKRHSGQVSFPGGMSDPGESVEETAIRETEEEVGISTDSIQIIGRGVSVVRFNALITPIVGYIGHIVPSELKINKHEVETAFSVPLANFCDPSTCSSTYTSDEFLVPVYRVKGYRIWGLTAYVTHVFLKCLLGDAYKFKLNEN